MRRLTAGHYFDAFPQAKVLIVEPLTNGIVAEWNHHGIEFLFQSRWSQIGEHDFRVIWIVSGWRLDKLLFNLFVRATAKRFSCLGHRELGKPLL